MSANKRFHLINDLKPFKDAWRVQVKLIHSWIQNPPYADETLEMVLADQTGAKVQCSCKITLIKRVQHSDLTNDSSFLSLASYEEILNGSADTKCLIDIIGQAIDIGEVQIIQVHNEDKKRITFRIRDNITLIKRVQRNLPLGKWRVIQNMKISGTGGKYKPTKLGYKMNITNDTVFTDSDLTDDSSFLSLASYEEILNGSADTKCLIVGNALACCLWGRYAEQIEHHLEKHVGEDIVCLIRFAKIRDEVVGGSIKFEDLIVPCLISPNHYVIQSIFNVHLYNRDENALMSIRISSAPSFGFENPEIAQEQLSQAGCYQWSEAIRKHIVLVLHSGSAVVRSTVVTCFAGITSSVFVSFSQQEREFVTSSIINAALHDKSPSVRSAACRAIGVVSCFSETSLSIGIYEKFILAVEANTRDPLISVRVTASWALANVCEALRYRVNDTSFGGSNTTSQVVDSLIECALRLTEDGDKVKANAVRALGSISKYVKLRCMTNNHDVLPSVHHHLSGAVDSSWLERTVQAFLSCVTTGNVKVKANAVRALGSISKYVKLRCMTNNHDVLPSVHHHLSGAVDSSWLERTVQAFLSCVTTGNVKVQWNVCHALSNLFSNETVKLQDMDWAPSVFSILLLLLRDASNFKIRIQAAAALAVPVTPLAYGRSFPDVVKGVWHTLQNLNSDRETTPTNFKYKKSLENQLTSTMLHLLSLVSSGRCEALTDFLLKKASFLEEWLRGLCVTLKEEDNASGSGSTSTSGEKQKKELISRAIRSLARSLEAGHNPEMALKLQELDSNVKANAVRALGSISKYVKLRCMTSNHEVLPSVHHHLSGAVNSSWLERTVQAFLSCVTTGNVKVQWNVCHALSNLFSNETVKLQDMDWAPSVFSILLLLLRDASNFKIRIQAAAALAVPVTPLAYGRSFPDVVKGVWHTLQNLNTDRETTPTNFKYKKSLENQLTSTMLHLLSLVSSGRCEALTDFLLKKASFLEEWLRGLCVTLKEEDNASGSGSTSTSGEKQKKELISRAIRSLARSLEAGHNPEMALKLQELASNVN
ncbi:hypothetical protein F2Q69_00034050 [Brassica cretica]|uniref:Replication protein A 70 kDa DNA-binding subunit B/D first OB fold domain-containing protein n=1 Tax=Brassica cretica TaxID=69181 RepID=A0A8S9SPR0_BRACR|nr:hypothetical protein F2Q69_00034050 [Brassica cretica]